MPDISRFKFIAIIIIALITGFTAGFSWMLYLAKTGPEQLFVDGLHIQTTEAVVNLALLKEKRDDDLKQLLEARIAMSGTAERTFHHPTATANARMIKGYYSLIANENPPPAIAAILSQDTNTASDPRPLADAMLRGSQTVLNPPNTAGTK